MGRRGLLGGILGAIGGAALGGPFGALAGAALLGSAVKSTEPRYTTVREHERRIGGDCFIATACYGIESEEVKILRQWRDDTLLKNQLGKQFVNVYYTISPPIVNFISDKPFLKRVVKLGLSPITKIAKLSSP